ncbi:hypothetical protein COLO4_06665 [Corchorus olitorius]|uniref:Uncharacterized protein n=1 Tax=Corchorus olitorius TaxID=93759 RepID=A0A1R3KMC5_9ROSI|nr:hypothetical protein COLO4_06665 [Corchorus olitorius]
MGEEMMKKEYGEACVESECGECAVLREIDVRSL